MAHFYPLPSGRVRCQIALRGIRKSQTFATKGAARAWAMREEAAILDGGGQQWPSKTLADAIRRYLKEVTPTKGGATAEAVMLNHTLADFPDLCAAPLHSLTTEDLTKWRDKRLETVSGSTVIRYGAVLRNVWTVAAKEWKWCPRVSPWSDLRFPTHNPARERINGWREIRVMLRRLNYFTGRPPGSMQEQVAYAWLIALRTAMRAQEVRQIAPDVTDLAARVVTLNKHKTIKATGRPRHVPITKQAARLIACCPAFTVSAGSLDALFRKAREQCGLDGFTFHDSRATALTLLSRKADILTLQRISGHRNINQLTGYYRESSAAIAARL
jgi:integrase